MDVEQGYTRGTEKGRGDRITRGIALYREHHEEIADIGDGFFIVPSSEPGRSYVVDVERKVCECRDYTARLSELPTKRCCKHIIAAMYYRAKGGDSEWSPSPRPGRRCNAPSMESRQAMASAFLARMGETA